MASSTLALEIRSIFCALVGAPFSAGGYLGHGVDLGIEIFLLHPYSFSPSNGPLFH